MNNELYGTILPMIIKVLYWGEIVMAKKTHKIPDTVVPASKWIPDPLFQTIQKLIPVACVDLIILRKTKGVVETLLIKRKIYPEENKWCLIGGRILKGERTKDTIRRQAGNELGVSVKIIPPWSETLPFAVYNDPVADKQKHFVALNFPVIITQGTIRENGPEFSEAQWFPLHKLPKTIGFHHHQVLKDFIKTRLPYSIKII